jgi:uncharacterized phage protein (TIGR01671 family)
MREIKFRAWIKKESRMTEVGVLSQNGKSITVDDSDMDGTYNRHVGGNKFELMQYTGLKDKNGKEIYEGDIVRKNFGHLEKIMTGESHKFEIIMANSAFKAVDMRSMFDNPQDFYLHKEALMTGNLKNFEIIGNIYEHNHLLKDTPNG